MNSYRTFRIGWNRNLAFYSTSSCERLENIIIVILCIYIYRTKTLFKMLLVHCDESKQNESELKNEMKYSFRCHCTLYYWTYGSRDAVILSVSQNSKIRRKLIAIISCIYKPILGTDSFCLITSQLMMRCVKPRITIKWAVSKLCLIPRTTVTSLWARQIIYAARRILYASIPRLFFENDAQIIRVFLCIGADVTVVLEKRPASKV